MDLKIDLFKKPHYMQTRSSSLFVLLLSIVFFGCKEPHKVMLSADEMPAASYTIFTGRDTTITTAKGALISIPRGAIRSSSDKVTLSIKEAYSITDIIKAGLITMSGGGPLSSGGMIYINNRDEDELIIEKPISISIPTKKKVKGMQVFKGNTTTDGSIEWTAPKPLGDTATINGKELFYTNCAACHNVAKDATGPALAFIGQRRDKKWLYDFTRNSQEVIHSGDMYADCLYTRYHYTAMPDFPQLTDEQLDAIYDYLGQERDGCLAYDSTSVPDPKRSFDSCVAYKKMMGELYTQRARIMSGARKAVVDTAIRPPSGMTTTANTTEPPSDIVSIEDHAAEYYRFTITSVGWYNIDILTKDMPGFENSELMVRVNGAYKASVDVYFVLPDNKIFLRGGLVKDSGRTYAFYKNNGEIPLPQNVRAYLFAIGTEGENVYFGSVNITTTLKQYSVIDMTPSSKENINEAIDALELYGLSIKTERTEYADDLRIIDSAIKAAPQLMPKGWDCSCLYPTTDCAAPPIERERNTSATPSSK